MRTLVESLKRLYEQGKVSLGKIGDMLSDEKITVEEYVYITGEDFQP